MKSLTTYLSLFILLLALGACGGDNATGPENPPDDPDDPPAELTQQQQDAIDFFKDLTIGVQESGNSNPVTRRWEQELRIFVGGSGTEELLNELDKIISEANQLVDGSNLTISVTEDTLNSTGYILFGSAEEFKKNVPSTSNIVKGGAIEMFIFTSGSNNNVDRMAGYVDTDEAGSTNLSRSLLRVAVSRGLGFPNISDRSVESIFNTTGMTLPTDYVQIDEYMIELLYHQQMRSGLRGTELDNLLKEIVTDIVPG